MKKLYIILAAVLSLPLLASCSDDLGIETEVNKGQEVVAAGKLLVTGTINKDPETRVSFEEISNTIKPSWEVNDQVFGFSNAGNVTYKVTSVDAAGVASFTRVNGTEPTDGTTVHMIYAPSKSVTDLSSQQLTIDLSQQAGTLAGLKNHAIMCATATVSENILSLQFENQVAIVGVKQFTGLKANTTYTSAVFAAYGPTAKIQVVEGVLKLVTDAGYGSITATGSFTSDASGNTNSTIYFAVPPHEIAVPHTFDLNASDDRRTGSISAKAITAGKYLYMTTKQMEENSLVQQWLFDGNTNNSVTSINASMTGTAPTLTTDRFGNENSAYNFGGNGGMLAEGAFEFGTSSFTANVWVCTTANGTSGHNILRTDSGYAGTNGCLLRFNKGKIEIWEGRSSSYSFISPYIYNNGSWHMLTYVRDVEARKGLLYVDGEYVGEYSISGTINNVTGNLRFGNVDGIEYYTGKMDDVRLYNKALSAKEVKNLYVPAELPQSHSQNFADYQPVEYIQTSQNSCVDVGIYCSSNLKAQFRYAQSGNIGGTIFGDYISEDNNFRFFATGGKFYFDCGNSYGSREYGGSMSSNQIYNLEIGNHYIKNLDTDATIASGSSKSFIKTYHFLLFNNLGGTSVKLYYMKIYESGVLVRDLVPCYNKQDPSVIGLFDKKNNVFYEATGATKGADMTEELTGRFSISSTENVVFSRGNLQYQASSGSWRFATRQYAYIGYAPGNTTSTGRDTQTTWIDLFGWGASGENAYGAQPYNASFTNSLFKTQETASSSEQLTLGNKADWGYAYSKANSTSGWFNMTKAQWDYLLDTRSASTINGVQNARFAKVTVNGANGLLVFPDVFTWDAATMGAVPSNINNANSSWGASYSISQFTAQESAGIVFLPAAGYHNNEDPFENQVGAYGAYWSSNTSSADRAFTIDFNSSYLKDYATQRSTGCSVRLVKAYN